MIRLEHPEHGAMHVRYEAEAKYNAQFGWRKAPEPEAPKPKVTEKPVEVIPTLKLKEKFMEKFGKKPHHNMNRHNIEKALNGDS